MSNKTTPPPPPSISPTPTNTSTPNPTCPFCTIATAYPPHPPNSPDSHAWSPTHTDPPSYVLLSTPTLLAFLDIAPLTRGHILIAPRSHTTKLGDLDTATSASLGRLLPLIIRAALMAVFPDIPPAEADYNVVQNNGARAAQVVGHVHFHVIPRPPEGYSSRRHSSHYADGGSWEGKRASWVMFGRGQRVEVDEEDAEGLVHEMRGNVWREVEGVRRVEGVDLLKGVWGVGEKL